MSISELGFNAFNWRRLILASDDLSSGAKYFALYLSPFMNDQQDVAFPSKARAAREMAVSERSVQKYIAELKGAGWLVVEPVICPKTGSKPSRYHASIPRKALEELDNASLPVAPSFCAHHCEVAPCHSKL